LSIEWQKRAGGVRKTFAEAKRRLDATSSATMRLRMRAAGIYRGPLGVVLRCPSRRGQIAVEIPEGQELIAIQPEHLERLDIVILDD
jgi:hypothetical protein